MVATSSLGWIGKAAWLQANKGVTVSTPEELSFFEAHNDEVSEDYLLQELMIFGFLLTPKGKEFYKMIEPLLKAVLDDFFQFITNSTHQMFASASAQPHLAIPATLLYTSMCERFKIIDHSTAQLVFGLSTGFSAAASIADLFKEGVTSIGFSSPRFVPSGVGGGLSLRSLRERGRSSAGKGEEVSEGEAGHTKGA